MIPARRKRLPLEAALMRVVAAGGIVGIGVAIAAIMTSPHSKGWVIGLVVSIVCGRSPPGSCLSRFQPATLADG